MYTSLTAAVAVLLSSSALAGVTASSEGKDADGQSLSARNAVDGLLSTAWAEGVEGDGDGSWLEISLDRPTDVTSVSIWPGRIDQGSRGLREYGRPHTLTVTLLGGPEEVSQQVRVLDIAETGPSRVDVPIQGQARRVRVTLDEAYGGGIRSDTYITEVAVDFLGAPAHPALEKHVAWREGAGASLSEKHDAEIDALKQAVLEAEFGDRDRFDTIRQAASDGAPFERERVARFVPDGFRAQAILPDRAALNALLELDDPNAIPALELAATRTTGRLQAAIQDRLERYRALAELKAGERRNVKPFGESGWCKGCLRAFGEPLPVAVDGFGALWIADLANHRVQQFGFDGIARGSLGASGEPVIASRWLSGERDWYASARPPSTDAGGFTLPAAVLVVPESKQSDGLIVLDGEGRVQRFDGRGAVQASWRLPIERPLVPKVGGTGHLTLAGKQVVVAWGDEAFVYDLDGGEVGRFTFEGGTVGGLVGFKNGRVGALHDGKLVSYNVPDGFVFGELLGDTLPEGFEFLGLAQDEKGKLWVVTDNGWAVKYKKPGKVDYQVRLVEYGFAIPRVDVYQDLVFVTDKDRIQKFDALGLYQQAQEAE